MLKFIKILFTTLLIITALLSVVGIVFYLIYLLFSPEIREKILKYLDENCANCCELSDEEDEVVKEHVQKTKRNIKPKKKNLKVALAKTTIQSSGKSLNERQKRILYLLDSKGKITMTDVTPMFSGVTQRTLRRDLLKLEQVGLVKQSGKTKNSVYELKIKG